MGAGREAPGSEPFTTVLFTDMVDSTSHAARLGDRAWAELLTAHNRLVREAVERHGGRVMDTAGDGFFVIFDGPDSALACARSAVAEVAALGIDLRCGVHTGDCIVVEDKCTGLAVHIGARLTALAAPGETLVTEAVVREAAGFAFEPRGERELRGVPGAWSLFALAG